MREKHYEALFVGGPADGKRWFLPEAFQRYRVPTFCDPCRFETFDYELVPLNFGELLLYADPDMDAEDIFRRLHSCYSPNRPLHSQPA
jgi:hypothetical protein